jgi:RNA polymerase sigma-70 factor (ECF subfamily)
LDLNDLYNSAREGDPKSEEALFELLAERFALFLQRRIMNGQAREDVVQDAIYAIASKYRGIEFKTSFAAWAYRVLNNTLKDHYRRKQATDKRFVSVPQSGVLAASSIVDPSFKSHLLECVRGLVRNNSRYGRVLNLIYQGYTVNEVCEKMGISRNNCYILLSRARSRLRRCLERQRRDK